MTKLIAKIFFGVAIGVSSLFATLVDYDFSGNFTKDNDVVIFDFTVDEASNVTVFSSSWVTGGFDPILDIWDASGNLIYQQDDGHNVGSTESNGVMYAHGDWDSYYSVSLAAGRYSASICQYNNFAVGTHLSQGFKYDNDPHFTYTQRFGTQPDFNGVLHGGNDPRTSDWEFHLLNVSKADVRPVPEPSTMSLILFSIIGLSGLAIRRKKN